MTQQTVKVIMSNGEHRAYPNRIFKITRYDALVIQRVEGPFFHRICINERLIAPGAWIEVFYEEGQNP